MEEGASNDLTRPEASGETMSGNNASTDMEPTMQTENTETHTDENPSAVRTTNANAKRKAKAKAKKKVAAKAKSKGKKVAAKAKSDAPKGPRGEKVLAIGKMLARKTGVTRAEVLEKTGWKAVSMQQQAEALGVKLRMEKEQGSPTRYFAG